MRRDSGYYWVKKNGVWYVLHSHFIFSESRNVWTSYDNPEKIYEDDFWDEINEVPITHPKRREAGSYKVQFLGSKKWCIGIYNPKTDSWAIESDGNGGRATSIKEEHWFSQIDENRIN